MVPKRKKDKCPVCNQRKGKRECPRKESLICSRCCGQIREPKKCSSDCFYFKSFDQRSIKASAAVVKSRAYRTLQPGSLVLWFERFSSSRTWDFFSGLVDLWKAGFKDCFGAFGASAKERAYHFNHYDQEFGLVVIPWEEALYLLKLGMRIRRFLQLPYPKEFFDFKSFLGQLDEIHVNGSIYKCYKCEEGNLSDDIVNSIRKVTLKDITDGVIGQEGETDLFFTCDKCLAKNALFKDWDMEVADLKLLELVDIYEMNPQEGAEVLELLVDEIYYDKPDSAFARQVLERNFSLRYDIADKELQSLRKVFPKIFETLTTNPNVVFHPFQTVITCICMNNIHKIRDYIGNLLEIFHKAKPENRHHYSHWMIDLAYQESPAVVLPVLDEIIALGVDDDNVLIVLSLVAENFPEKVIHLVPSIMNVFKIGNTYHTSQFFASLSLNAPETLVPYLETIEEARTVVKDHAEKEQLDECIRNVSKLKFV